MDIVLVVPKHTGFEPVSPEQEDFGLAILGHRDSTLVSLGHRDSIPVSLEKKEFVPVDLGH